MLCRVVNSIHRNLQRHRAVSLPQHGFLVLFQYALKKVRITDLSKNYWEEATTLHSLNHSHVLGYKAYFRDGDTFCLVMEYCPRGDLRKRIEDQKQQRQKFTENVIVNWIIPLCHALQVRISGLCYKYIVNTLKTYFSYKLQINFNEVFQILFQLL